MKNLYYRLNKISNAICRILTVLIVGIVIVNAGSVFLQVINRYIIVKVSDFSFPWTEELARYSMIWLCYLALPIVYREGSMAQLDLIFDRLGKKGKMVLYVITRILCLMVLAVAVYYGLYIVQTRMMFKSSILRAPGYTLYSAPVIGCILVTYEVITEMIGVFSGILEPFYAGEKDSIRKLRKEKKADVSVLDYSLPYNYADRHSGWICHGSADEYFLWDSWRRSVHDCPETIFWN